MGSGAVALVLESDSTAVASGWAIEAKLLYR